MTLYHEFARLQKREALMAGVKTEVDVAWMRFEESSVAGKWRTDNPGEYAQIKNYRSSDGIEPTDIETDFGLGLLALVKAGKIGDGTYQLAQDDL